jgi:hypothetical protein
MNLHSEPQSLSQPTRLLIFWIVPAVDAIGYAVRFQVKAVPQDPAMFRAWCRL